MLAMTARIEDAAVAAAKRLGYNKLKELQLKVIVGLVEGRDVFAVLPTGYGKSLCFGCLPWTYEALDDTLIAPIVCVITPLVAIIKDQVIL